MVGMHARGGELDTRSMANTTDGLVEILVTLSEHVGEIGRDE